MLFRSRSHEAGVSPSEYMRECFRNGHVKERRQARAVMVALRAQEHLRLVFQAAERFRVRDAVDGTWKF